jgi:hypothetical protein
VTKTEQSRGSMETVAEALQRLTAGGYTDDFHAEAGGLRSRSTGRLHPPEALHVDEVVRFEGDTDPSDESVVFALRSGRDGTKGTYTTAYGTYMDPLDADLVPRLGTGSSAERAISRGD